MKSREQTMREKAYSTTKRLYDTLEACANDMGENQEESDKLVVSLGIPATLTLLQSLVRELSMRTSKAFAGKILDDIVMKMNIVKEEIQNETEN